MNTTQTPTNGQKKKPVKLYGPSGNLIDFSDVDDLKAEDPFIIEKTGQALSSS